MQLKHIGIASRHGKEVGGASVAGERHHITLTQIGLHQLDPVSHEQSLIF